MNFVINTSYQSAGTSVLDGLEKRIRKAGYHVAHNDWDNYHKYDVAVFVAPDSKVREAKIKSPKIFCILFDPKISLPWQIKEIKKADMLIVSSIEQREALLRYNQDIFIYYMFPDTPEIKKEHRDKEKIIIGYHGNKQHLIAMRDLSWALDELAKTRQIEFWAIYNINKLGKWRKNSPKICKVKHIQWSEENTIASLKQCDIGVAPSVLPVSGFFSRPFKSFICNPEGYHNKDYMQRFKFSNNPGRIYVFSQLHIPVVADFTPSSCQLIKDMHSGVLAGTKEGWKNALDALITDHELRSKFSNNLKQTLDRECSIDYNFEKFLAFFNSNYAKKQQRII